MGEMADGLINGDFDFHSGEYIGKGQGIPRTKNKSLVWKKKDYTFSKDVAFKGVRRYLKRRISATDITPIINDYMPGTEKSLKQKCLAIQNNWGDFVEWINEKYGPPERKSPKE